MPQPPEKQIRSQINSLQSQLKHRQLENRPLSASIVNAYQSALREQYDLLDAYSRYRPKAP